MICGTGIILIFIKEIFVKIFYTAIIGFCESDVCCCNSILVFIEEVLV